MYIIIPLAKGDPLHLQLYVAITGIILTIGAASNAPILFINSNEYNKAYKKKFKILNKSIKKIIQRNQQRTTPVVSLQRSI
uniref:G_PROTEIN_RECEP_F1_2 domain-containing protein n=1 Tax=Meloidogyne hapla TaxID=6305 RepID=A0A1I8B5Z2_MELHA